MNAWRRGCAVLSSVAMLMLSGGAWAQSEDPQVERAALQAFVDGVVAQAMDDNDIAGAVVSVVYDGAPVLVRGYGFADAEARIPADGEQSLFRIGSIGKTYTWIALAQLIEQGALTLDTPINDVLPPANRIADDGFAQPILVRHLFTHSAGFEDRNFGHLFTLTEGRIAPLAEYLARHPPRRVRAPGEASSYSNYGAALAGLIAVSVAGAPDFPTLIERQILEPAGLRRTSFREPYAAREGLPAPISAELAEYIARGHVRVGDRFEVRPTEFVTAIAPAGSTYSTAADMARYMQFLMNDGAFEGAALYNGATAQGFRENLASVRQDFNGWPFGFVHQTYADGVQAFGHNGGTLYFFSNMMMYPELGLGVFVSTNSIGGDALAAELPERVRAYLFRTVQTPPRPGNPALIADAARYAGFYAHTRRAYGGLEGFIGSLISGVTVSVTEDGYLRLSGAAQGDFVPMSQEGLFQAREGEGRILFSFGGDGRATRWVQDTNSVAFDRLPAWRDPMIFAIGAAGAFIAALLVLAGFAYRSGRPATQTALQRGYTWLEGACATAWLLGFGLLGAWVLSSDEPTTGVEIWPGPLMGGAGFASIAASTGVLALAVLAWPVMQASNGWSNWRKARHAATFVVFAGFAALAAVFGLSRFS